MADRHLITVREVTYPAGADDADVRVSVDISNAVMADLVGHGELDGTYAEARGQWQPTPYGTNIRLLAEVAGIPVGRGYVGLPFPEAPDKAYVNVWVLPGHRGQGVGTALLRRIEAITAAHDRTRLQAWAMSPRPTGELLTARTGFGAVAADAPGTRFAVAAGFVLQQVQRMSRWDPHRGRGHLEKVLADARRSARAYRVVAWTGFTPPDHIDDMAWLCSRMSTDAPHGDIAVDEQVWDADRVRATEKRQASDDRELLTAAAEHVATGRLVAYTMLTVPTAAGRVARQEDTLVTADHRGHRLGALVKAANLLRLAEHAPGVPAVYTWNAEENRPMLDVNAALAFEAVGAEGQWERTTPLELD
jgi:GNAT superfamily N-acetyltransferase